jgi:outer membrane receptor protein involved in Fe transport
MRKSVWLLSAALFAAPAPVFAQQSDPGQPTQPTGPSGDAQVNPPNTAAPAAVDNTDVGQQPVDSSDIVVTATRRNQALSDVPLAVSAVTGENLANSGAHDIRQLNQLSPSLLVSSTSSEGGAAVARIRGIGTVGDNPGLEGSVGIFIDGVYRARAGMALTELGPLERIEVLRGPQGTLFGRNTSAGLISVITAQPRFDPEISGAIEIGNYDERRAELSVTGPVSSTVAARLDAVYLKRDGFLKDVISGRDVNDRNRWLLRGQVLFQPSDSLSDRIVVDYTRRREECCAATYLPAHDFTAAGEQPSTIAAIERGLGAFINDNTFRRRVSITPGRDYDSDVDDWGASNELSYDFGGVSLTSITAYRYNKYDRGQDADFNNLDILFRASDGNSFNRFKTFTQELRLNGKAFDNRLDWLVGAYFANENLHVKDNLAYGNDYGRYSNCLVSASFAGASGQPGLLDTTNPTCFNTAIAGALFASPLFPAASKPALAAFARLGAFGGAPFTNSGFTNLAIALGGAPFVGSTLNGSALDDLWKQKSNNWALFTHNIFSITNTIDLTVGARYTHEKKKLRGNLADDNVLCGFFSAAIPSLQTLPCVSPTVGPAGLAISDSKSENKLSGTVVLSWKPTPSLLTYASYSRGYKAGGFNLDRSALFRANGAGGTSGSGAICSSPVQPGCGGIVASGSDLQFKPETNDAFELGAKYNGPGFDVNVALFHELFRNFQLNTFNGLNFVVENINSCKHSLDGADEDNDATTGTCTGGTRAGVRSQGVEVEAFTRPMRYLDLNAGVTYADTKYRHNLVGANGRALTSALFALPGQRLSNSNLWTLTGAVAWTPPIGGSGLSALVYADARHMSGFNTGSDLDVEKFQPAFTVVNARVGVRGRDNNWSIELWAQNLFDENYRQVAFDAPVQGAGTTGGNNTRTGVIRGFYPRANQLFGAFLGEPRTFGITFRAKFNPGRAAVPYVAPPAPPPPPQEATQVCADGTTILASATCPAAPPPPPPAAAPERGM